MTLHDTPVADYDGVFAEFIRLPSSEDHRLNPAIRTLAIENPQLCVSPSSLMLDSTPCASEEQGNDNFLVHRTPLSAVRSLSPYVCKSKPRATLAVCQADDSRHQVANEGYSNPGSQPSTALVTSESHRNVSSKVLGKRKQGEDSCRDLGGNDEKREPVDVELKRRVKRAKESNTQSRGRIRCSNNCGKTFSRVFDEKRHRSGLACKKKPPELESKKVPCVDCGKRFSRYVLTGMVVDDRSHRE
jgi:hypothetical protein